MSEAFTSAWLGLQCQMIPGAVQGMAALDISADGAFEPQAWWPEDAPKMNALESVARLAVSRRSPVVAGHGGGLADAGDESAIDIAFPLLDSAGAGAGASARLDGVVAVRVRAPLSQQQAILQVLRWGAAWLGLLRSQPASGTSGTKSAGEAVASATLGHQPLRAAATAAAGELAHLLGCRRVSIGCRDDAGRIEVVALSDTARFDPRTNLMRRVEAAMEEAHIRGETVVHNAGDVTAAPAHAELVREENAGAVCTVVLTDADRVTGAVVFEQPARRRLDPVAVATCESAVTLLGPLLELKRDAERPALARLRMAAVQRFWRPVGLLGLAGVVLLAIVAIFAQGEFRISATAALEGTVHRAIVAPYDGHVAAAGARAGETVAAGAMLAELDRETLELELRKLLGERDALAKQYRKALADLDQSEARIIQSQIAQADAHVALAENHLERSRLTAPFDGVVIAGDLSRSLGAPVDRGDVLFEIAPLDSYRVSLEIAARDISHVHVGQPGSLRLSALPNQRFSFVVDNVSSISHAKGAQASFRVEARLDESPPRLRPGMRGVGKVSVDRRRLVWIWTRRPREWLGLVWWAWSP